jgi:DNA polymerase III subunit gamma/tau
MAGDDRVVALAEAVVAKDAGKALAVLDETAQGGLQMGELVDQMLAYWRDLMVVHCAGEQASDLSVPSRCRPDLIRQGKALTLDAVLAGLDVLSTTRLRLRDSSHGRTLVEMALVRLCRLSDLLPVAQLAQMLTSPERERGVRQNPSLALGAGKTLSTAPPEGLKKKLLSSAVDAPSPKPASPAVPTPESLPQVWSQILRSVGPMMGNFLEKAGLPAITGPNSLVLHFSADYNQAREYCQEPARLAKIEEAVRKGTGHPWILRVEGNAPAPTTAPAPAVEAAPALPPRRNHRAEAEKEPLVKRAVDALGAQIVRVEDGFGEAP